FVERLIPDKLEEMNTTIGEIAKKLNKEYYNLDKEDKEHMYVVGSVGRGTAIKGVSDLDLIFDLLNKSGGVFIYMFDFYLV
ncbi:nucleotidyltransferase domain-containing protein, partial [uncultured Parasutterella sp.]|uniref:SMODS domain-containing nucleotidyltransferase n=1 Tax=uncultured Parasutterella sp. TaxID=1263098 RepID=UPI0025967158